MIEKRRNLPSRFPAPHARPRRNTPEVLISAASPGTNKGGARVHRPAFGRGGSQGRLPKDVENLAGRFEDVDSKRASAA